LRRHELPYAGSGQGEAQTPRSWPQVAGQRMQREPGAPSGGASHAAWLLHSRPQEKPKEQKDVPSMSRKQAQS
jgi:hypothetical protein